MRSVPGGSTLPPGCLTACCFCPCPPPSTPPAGWVGKKVKELLGEEPSFVAFIMDQLKARTGAEVSKGAACQAGPMSTAFWEHV